MLGDRGDPRRVRWGPRVFEKEWSSDTCTRNERDDYQRGKGEEKKSFSLGRRKVLLQLRSSFGNRGSIF